MVGETMSPYKVLEKIVIGEGAPLSLSVDVPMSHEW